MSKCWLCGNPATTREHQIKRTSLATLFGNNFKKPLTKTFSNGTVKQLQSPTSDHIKYQINLCHSCNSAKTQPSDLAYEKFFNFLVAHEREIFLDGQINFRKIISELNLGCRKKFQQYVFKYFIKSFCCMIDSTKTTENPPLSVPSSLINALNNQPYKQNFFIKFYSNGDLKNWPLKKIIDVTDPVLSISPLGSTFMYCESYGWLSIFYIYQNINNSHREIKILQEEIPNYWVGKTPQIFIERA